MLLRTAFCLVISSSCFAETEARLPDFGQDTVLVWEIPMQDGIRNFVVRLARFYPDLFLEWEDARSQGTVFIPNRDILEAQGYVNKKLFESGRDIRSADETTLWLSREIFRELKEKKKAKCIIDRVPGRMTYEGEDTITVKVNGSPMVLPVIKVRDDRGSEKWFLDQMENPLMAKYTLRQYSQVLVDITTNRKNSLRWIKGRKLNPLFTN